MRSDVLTFADLVARGSLTLSDGYRTKASELGGDGIPILRVAEVADGSINPTSADRIRTEYRNAIGSKLSQAGDVLLTTKGTVGRRAIVPPGREGLAYSPQLCFFRVLDTSINERWLYYWLAGKEFWAQAHGVSTQTDMAPYISLRDLRAIRIELPPVSEQREIAATLGALDDKIDSNRRAIALIESLFEAEFERAVGAAEVKSVPLADLVSITKGVSYRSADLQPSLTSLVTLKSIDRAGGYKKNGLKPYTGSYRPQQVIEPGDIVVAQTDLTQGAEVVGRAVRVPAASSAEVLVASLDLAIVRPRDGILPEYLLGVLTNRHFREHCRSRTSGTTVLHLATDAIPTFLAPIVSQSVQHDFSRFGRPLIERADLLNAESEELAALRDTLLTELLSGRLQAFAADKLIS